MNKKELQAIAREAAKSIKTEQDLNDFSRMLKKITVETALGPWKKCFNRKYLNHGVSLSDL